MLTAVTYIRDRDRTRVVFVLPLSREEALARAVELAPHDFKLAAVCHPEDGARMRVPMDGDNYGSETAPPFWTPSAVSAVR